MDSNKSTFVAAILAIASLAGFLGTIAFLAIGVVPEANKDLFNIALMALVGFVGTAFGYYLGASASKGGKPGDGDVKDPVP